MEINLPKNPSIVTTSSQIALQITSELSVLNVCETNTTQIYASNRLETTIISCVNQKTDRLRNRKSQPPDNWHCTGDGKTRNDILSPYQLHVVFNVEKHRSDFVRDFSRAIECFLCGNRKFKLLFNILFRFTIVSSVSKIVCTFNPLQSDVTSSPLLLDSARCAHPKLHTSSCPGK